MGSVLSIASLVDIWFTYDDHRSALGRLQREQVAAAAARISLFVREIETQLGWMTHLSWSHASPEQRELDALRLLRQVPAISNLRLVDGDGRERLRFSREAMDKVDGNADLSRDEAVMAALSSKTYYGPVYFRKGTEPYMSLAVSGARRDAGIAIADVNLTHIWDVVNSIRAGRTGQAYVVDAQGRLIAHPDISLVLRNTDLTKLPQVRRARGAQSLGDEPESARNLLGKQVVTVHARAEPLDWLVFVEIAEDEANEPLYSAITRSVFIAATGLLLALLSAMLLARHMVVPIQQLTEGAARIGKGILDRPSTIRTGDELERLGDQFNQMAAQLRSSYSTLERKVEERTQELQRAVHSKSRFLAVASHDLRQPLHALNLLVAQLSTETETSERVRLTQRIDEALADINELFNALLDISRLDAGSQNTTIASFPINDVLLRIEAMFAAAALEKGLHFALVPCSLWVRSDPLLLERILLNIVSNALRYTAEGGVVVGCRRSGETLRIDVCDSGIGIPPEQQQIIFSEFYRGGPQAREAGDGLGLGLAIVERLCTLLHHPVGVVSEPGKGSRFSVALPVVPPDTEPKPRLAFSASTIDSADKLVAIIDDDPLVLDGTAGLLKSWGFRVVAFSTARDAADSLKDLRPALVISDYQLDGDRNGVDLILEMRSVLGEHIPSMIISGNIAPALSATVEAQGLLLLHKPVQPMALRAAVTKLLATV